MSPSHLFHMSSRLLTHVPSRISRETILDFTEWWKLNSGLSSYGIPRTQGPSSKFTSVSKDFPRSTTTTASSRSGTRSHARCPSTCPNGRCGLWSPHGRELAPSVTSA